MALRLRGLLLLAAVAVTAATAACGSNSTSNGEAITTIAEADTTIAEADTTNREAGAAGPPGAVARLDQAEVTLALGSSCWSGDGVATCAEALAPSVTDNLPKLRVQPGDIVRFELQFVPKRVLLELLDEQDSRVVATELTAKASTDWAVPDDARQAAVALLRVSAADGVGDVDYVFQLESN